jgi:hypothetical protein
MTSQFHDVVHHRGQDYYLADVCGSGLFDPRSHGIERPKWNQCTACDRAYVSFYAVQSRRLLLDQLAILADHATLPPKLFGIEPRPDPRGWLDLRYDDLKHPVRFTGGMVLGHDLIDSIATLWPFDGWRWRAVRELEFEQGELIDERDRSEELDSLRRKHEGVSLLSWLRRHQTPAWIDRYIHPDYWTYRRDQSLPQPETTT